MQAKDKAEFAHQIVTRAVDIIRSLPNDPQGSLLAKWTAYAVADSLGAFGYTGDRPAWQAFISLKTDAQLAPPSFWAELLLDDTEEIRAIPEHEDTQRLIHLTIKGEIGVAVLEACLRGLYPLGRPHSLAYGATSLTVQGDERLVSSWFRERHNVENYPEGSGYPNIEGFRECFYAWEERGHWYANVDMEGGGGCGDDCWFEGRWILSEGGFSEEYGITEDTWRDLFGTDDEENYPDDLEES